MTRLIGPDEASREVKAVGPRGVFYAKADRPAQLWADDAATIPADVLFEDGSAIPVEQPPNNGGRGMAPTVAIDSWSMLPLIQYPPNDVDFVVVTCDGGPPWRAYARTDDRLDTLGGRVTSVEGDIGGLAVTSTPVDAAWPGWDEQIVALGFVPATDRIFQRIQGVFETDAMFSVRGGRGRWGSAHQYGSHVFEAWNKDATNRLTMLVGLNATDEAALFVTAPLSSTWGKVRVGTDTWNRGTLFGRDLVEFFEAADFRNTAQFDAAVTFNASATFAQGLTLATDKGLSATGNTGGIEVGGGSLTGFNQRDGAALALRGGQHPSAPGTATLYLGSYAQATATSTSLNVDYIAGPATSPVSVFSVRGDGLVSVITGRLRLATSLPPSSATGGGSAGLIAWDANFIYVCTGTNQWKRAALATW